MNELELRVGNLVSGYDKKGNTATVVVTNYDFIDDKINDFKPLYLTKEWAEKNAAAINNSVQYYFNSKSNFMPCIQFDDNGMAYWIANESYSVELPYVHTWQNLFFALTKTELKL